jgi:hypothetical protein
MASWRCPSHQKLRAFKFAHRKTRIAYLGFAWHQAVENIRHSLHSRSAAALPAAGRLALLVQTRSRLACSAILSPLPPDSSSACKAMLQTTAAPAASLPAAASTAATASHHQHNKLNNTNNNLRVSQRFASCSKIGTESLAWQRGFLGAAAAIRVSMFAWPLP